MAILDIRIFYYCYVLCLFLPLISDEMQTLNLLLTISLLSKLFEDKEYLYCIGLSFSVLISALISVLKANFMFTFSWDLFIS